MKVTSLKAMRTNTIDMKLDDGNFALIAGRQKTIEVRVNDAKRHRLKNGMLIRFTHSDQVLVAQIHRLTHYSSFSQLLDKELLHLINPNKDRAQQLTALRTTYSFEQEALGVVAIQIKLLSIKDDLN